MRYIPIILFAFLLVFNCTANGSSVTEPTIMSDEEDPPSRWQLRRNFYDKGEILIVYDADDQATLDEYNSLLRNIENKELGRRARNIKIKHKLSSQVSEEEIKNSVLFIIGTPDANPLISKLTATLPLSFIEDGFRFNDKTFFEKSDILSSSYFPNPNNTDLPFFLVTGNDDLAILGFLKEQFAKEIFLNQSMDLEIYRNNNKLVVGGFNRKWKVDPNAYFDFTNTTESFLATDHFRFITHDVQILQEELDPFSTLMEESVKRMRQFFNSAKSLSKVEVHLYKSAEEKGLLLGNTQQASVDFKGNQTHIVYNDQYKGNYLQKENALFIRNFIGESNQEILENGLTIYFTNNWQREGYLYWAARLSESENALSLTNLFDQDIMEYESPIIKECMSAAFVSFLIEHWGKETFLTKYLNWNPSEDELKETENAWQSFLQNLIKAHPKKIRNQDTERYLKGFNFAHEGYSIYNGYLSTLATRSLEKQANLGANAIAIVPYTGMSDPNKAVPLRISEHAGSENVQGIVHSAYEAKKLGMVSMLKPQIWLRGSWPGDINMSTQEEWDDFFDYYHRWIKHFALVAEIHDIEMFCIGVEFSAATLAQEDKWREIFKSIRRLYQGKITYAANWGYEFEQVQFWDELDFIGLNCYYPLSASESPTDKELRNNFTAIKDKIEKVYKTHKKPIVFTEIGFRSTPMPWKNPHAEESDIFKAKDQARCYEIIFEGIQDEPWCQGILWWKFPSYLDWRGIENNAFTPNNKDAEMVVKKWFAK